MRASGDGWAVVTGASSGIGAAIARELSGGGWSVMLIGRDPDRLSGVGDDCWSLGARDVRSVSLDVRSTDAFAAVMRGLEEEAPIRLFVACAGLLDGRREGEIVETAEVARAVLGTNLTATIEGVRAVSPGMIARGEGTIVLVASLAAFAPLADAPAYSASKAGLVAYGLALREALEDLGVRVCVACPGYVATPMSARHCGARPGEIGADEAARRILAGVSKNRAMTLFPTGLGLLALLSRHLPEPLRRLGTKRLRFHVETAEADGGAATPAPPEAS